jgi:hypothetical protein
LGACDSDRAPQQKDLAAIQPSSERWITSRSSGHGAGQGAEDGTPRRRPADAPTAPGRRGRGTGAAGLALLLGAAVLSGCAPQLASGIAPAPTGALAGPGAVAGPGQAEQACAGQQGGGATPAACPRGTQLAQAAVAAGGAGAAQPPAPEQRTDSLKFASEVVKLLSDTGGVANAITQWRTAFGRTTP